MNTHPLVLSERPGEGLGHAGAMPLWLNFKQMVFRDLDVIAVGQEPCPPCPLLPGYQTGKL